MPNGTRTYKARVGIGGDFTASPWGYNGEIFCLSEQGMTYVIAAGDKFELPIPTIWTRCRWRPRPWSAIGAFFL
jgi:hypothetical protein